MEDSKMTSCGVKKLTDEACVAMLPAALKNIDLETINFCDKMTDNCLDLLSTTFKLAANGKVKELEEHLSVNPEHLNRTDCKGRTALHWAARRGQLSVIEYVLNQDKETLNAVDNAGNTAVHHAVDGAQCAAVDMLLNCGADCNIKNKLNMAPVHMAVDLDRRDVLKALLQHPSVDVELGGDHGSRPLHYAARKDHAKCAVILLDHGARMCSKDDLDRYPIHMAAQNCARATLELLIQLAEKKGYKREGLLKFVNQEKNTPLHVAVNSGDIKAVRLCLEAGSAIDLEQEDGASPIHLAASQGAVEMMRLMFDCQPDKKASSINARDHMLLTPLHKAAIFDRPEAIRYLLSEGADIEAKNQEDQSTLLLAAAKRSWQAVDCLIGKGASLIEKDATNRNLIHLVIQGGGKPTDFHICFQTAETKALLNEKDDNGCTPLHYASQGGYLNTIDVLLRLGAVTNAKNNNMESPLHFAARHGRYNTCRRLLDTSTGSASVNEMDGLGHTPVHVAAQNGHTKVVTLLLQNGAGVFRDLDGNTPLHLVAATGYTTTATELLSVHSHLLNSANKDGNTPLHIAAMHGQSNLVTVLLDMGATFLLNKDTLHFLDLAIEEEQKEVAIAVISNDRWKAVMDMGSEMFGSPILGMIKHMPEVCQMVLDRCRVPSGCDDNAPDFHYVYNFTYLQTDIKNRLSLKKSGKYIPLLGLNAMVQYNRVECLSHPVCSTYLKMKWMAFGLWFHLLNLFIYLVFLFSLTVFVSTYDYSNMSTEQNNTADVETVTNNNTQNTLPTVANPAVQSSTSVSLASGQKILAVIILIFCLLNALKEIMQVVQQKLQYFTDLTNLVEWILYITSTIFILPFLLGYSVALQWECGAIAVFLAWFNLLLFLQRFDFIGIYVVMFMEILRTLIQVLVVFSVLIIAFAFSFFILLQHSDNESRPHGSPGVSIITATVMMLGNIDYIETWVHPYTEGNLPFDTLSFIMLMVFILLMPILLINLLIGLAVGDIEAVQRDARLKRIAMQVQFISYMEERLPQRLMELVDKTESKEYPNRCANNIKHFWSRMTKSGKSGYGFDKENVAYADNELEHKTFLYQELHKQKRRLNQISVDLNKHYELLRLIVQKMEIRTEANDDDDNGDSLEKSGRGGMRPAIGWSSPQLRQVLVKQATLAKWSSKDDA